MKLNGISVSAGVAVGQIVNIETTPSSEQSCIIVTRNFTPDIIVNYRNAKGIVSENGGATCHAAIIARTMGIPCISGVNNATTLLQTGKKGYLLARELLELGEIEVIE